MSRIRILNILLWNSKRYKNRAIDVTMARSATISIEVSPIEFNFLTNNPMLPHSTPARRMRIGANFFIYTLR
jgi:hypothetical protein